ncbi:expressed unknown protein [Seminavis robusta]|uniref:Uncharacterized protein n=1 Tax=Seminavis robusta TaxID=568900 RepID=A0A9N8EPB6_9STRA|nr:expressed unknown protein [Seminavis robusta]|eukprot:Sro1482_g276300.1 n/a (216) ;mRNA; f:14633-15280
MSFNSTTTAPLSLTMSLEELVSFKRPTFAHWRTLEAEYYAEIFDTLVHYDKPFRWFDVHNMFYTATNLYMIYTTQRYTRPAAETALQRRLLVLVNFMQLGGLAWHFYECAFDDACLVHVGGTLFVSLMLQQMWEGGKRLFWSHTVVMVAAIVILVGVENHDPTDPSFHLRHWIGHILETTLVCLLRGMFEANYRHRQLQRHQQSQKPNKNALKVE